jgi:hypothetical protein
MEDRHAQTADNRWLNSLGVCEEAFTVKVTFCKATKCLVLLIE